ncbi:MAG TPA: AAA family ATPase [Candidatus Binatia bacterium]|nr:AAA family ATPase [Candidatus Binatia bacterium]
MERDEVVRFVGVTGLPGAGKGAFIDLLRPLLAESGIATRYFSLSDELRAEARRRGLPVERPILRSIANELRREQGSGVLSTLLVRKIRRDLRDLPVVDGLVVIVDAIRNPEEVRVLRRELEPKFTLVAVEAPLEILVNRIASRARFDEPDEFVQQKEAARKMILGESGKNEPAHGHNIAECVAQADWHLDNSGSLQDLTAATRRFIDAVILVPAHNE